MDLYSFGISHLRSERAAAFHRGDQGMCDRIDAALRFKADVKRLGGIAEGLFQELEALVLDLDEVSVVHVDGAVVASVDGEVVASYPQSAPCIAHSVADRLARRLSRVRKAYAAKRGEGLAPQWLDVAAHTRHCESGEVDVKDHAKRYWVKSA